MGLGVSRIQSDYLLLERINSGGMAEVDIAKSFVAEGFGRLLAVDPSRLIYAMSP